MKDKDKGLFAKCLVCAKLFLQKYNIDPPICNGDQMPFHRNESSEQQTLHYKGQDVFVNKKHMSSRERITCFTTVSHHPR